MFNIDRFKRCVRDDYHKLSLTESNYKDLPRRHLVCLRKSSRDISFEITLTFLSGL